MADDVGKSVGCGVVVDVGDKDGTEEFAREEGVVWVFGQVDGGVDIVTLAAVVLAANDEFELRVCFGVVDYAREFLERGFVNDGADEVGEVGGLADFQGRDFFDEDFFEFRPCRLGDIEARAGAAFLALVLERAADRLDGGVVHVGVLVDEMEVLAASLTDNPGVALVLALGNAVGNLSVQLSEDCCAASVMQGCELPVSENLLCDFHSVTRDPLDDVWWKSSLDQNLVEKPVGGDCRWRWLPHNDVTHQSWGCGEVTANGCEVERRYGVDEAFEGSVFNTAISVSFGLEFGKQRLHILPHTGRVVDWLVAICLFRVLDIEPQKVTQLRCCVNLGLPCILSLSHHCRCHDLISVLCGNEICRLEKH